MELAVKTAESEDVILMQYVLLFGFFSSQSWLPFKMVTKEYKF